MSPLLKPFHPGLSQVFAFSIWTETSDFTFNPSETLKQYPMELTSLEEWVQDRVAESSTSVVGLAGT
jgi:hypothetical protein